MGVIAYRLTKDGTYPLSAEDVRFRSPLLFGAMPPDEVLEAVGAEKVELSSPPAFDAATQSLSEIAPTKQGAVWRQTWAVTTLPVLPIRVSAVQAKTALYDAGLFEKAEAAIGAHPYPLVRIWWASAQEWVEDHPYVYLIAPMLEITEDRVHDLFVAASAVAV